MAAALVGVGLVLALPGTASAANEPTVSAPSVSYSGQSGYTITVNNRLANSRILARISNAPNFADTAMSCSGSGTGTWRCSVSGRRLNIGRITVRVQAVNNLNPSLSSGVVTRTASVTSSFAVNNPGGPIEEGRSFSVTGRYDHLSGVDDYRVRASVTSGGRTVLGQSGIACSTSGNSFSCPVRTQTGLTGSATYSIRVTETNARTGDSRSATVTKTVTSQPAPNAPSVNVPNEVELEEQPVVVRGDAGRSGLTVQIAVDGASFSAPTTTCTSGGGGAFACSLPGTLQPGAHQVAVRVFDPEQPTKISATTVRRFTVLKKEETPKPTPTPTPSAPVVPSPTAEPTTEPTPDATPAPLPEPEVASPKQSQSNDALIMLAALGLAVAALARPGPLSLMTRSTSVGFTDNEPRPEEPDAGVGFGDQSGTWAFLGHELVDEFSVTAPARLAPHSPLLGRVTDDGHVLRAILGGVWWLFYGGALLLGAVAAGQTGLDALPPPTGLIVLIMLLGIADAGLGLLATGAFAALALLGGLQPSAGHAIAVLLALGLLWAGLPLVVAALRPLRRFVGFSRELLWDRVADAAIAGLIGALFAFLVARSFDAIAGQPTALPDDAGVLAVAAGLGLAARIALADLAGIGWPERLRVTGLPDGLPTPSYRALIAGMLVRIVVVGIASYAILDGGWAWALGMFFIALPDLISVADDRFRWEWSHQWHLPVGLTAVLVMVLGGLLFAVGLGSLADTAADELRFAFLGVAAFVGLFAVLQTFDATGPRRTSWLQQGAGVVVAVGLASVVLAGWNF